MKYLLFIELGTQLFDHLVLPHLIPLPRYRYHEFLLEHEYFYGVPRIFA